MSKKLSAKIASWVGERPDEWILKEWIQDAIIQEASIPNVPTLRDQFAMNIMAGFCANTAIFAANGMSGWDLVNCTEEQLAGCAYRLSDSMLKARGE